MSENNSHHSSKQPSREASKEQPPEPAAEEAEVPGPPDSPGLSPIAPPALPEIPIPPTSSAALNTEFVYHSALLKQVADGLTDLCLRRKAIPWIRKLFAPEYSSSQFKEKRNRYLCSLCLSLMNNEMLGVFSQPPPEGALPDVDALEVDDAPPASWEVCTQWQENLEGVKDLPGKYSKVPCSAHTPNDPTPSNRVCPTLPASINISNMLDDEFQFFLYTARPYIALIPVCDDRTKASAWCQVLCTIDQAACPVMKGIRNDYMCALLGSVSDLHVSGPFDDYPTWGTLYPLSDAATFAAYKHPFTDPTSREANDFLKMHDLPKEGAFCYVAVTGELLESNLPMASKSKTSSKDKGSELPKTSLNMSLASAPPSYGAMGKPGASSTPYKPAGPKATSTAAKGKKCACPNTKGRRQDRSPDMSKI